MYIRSTGNISPQPTFGHRPLLEETVDFTTNRLSCIEPDYKELIDAKLIRRMSRIIRMGVAAALECLAEAGVTEPGAIITGTAYGCLEDTGLFLTKMVEYKEELLTPTAFIQSTHNTIGAQIGLILQSNNYNNTFVHRGFSFESALLDAMMLLNEQEADNVLVGAIDEITNISFTLLNRSGLYRQGDVSSRQLYASRGKGTIAGEGSAFFLLASEPSGKDYAKIDGMHTFYKPGATEAVARQVESFLSEHKVSLGEIDLVITGNNGDDSGDKIYNTLGAGILAGKTIVCFKNLCGEYPTASAFAMWLGASILKAGSVPKALFCTRQPSGKVRRILIYNHYLEMHHSLVLLSAC